MSVRRHFAVAMVMVSLAFSTVSESVAQEWTRFRGPNGQGTSEAANLPVKWTESDYNWKIELPGGGHSSPVIWGDKVFVTSGYQESGQGVVLALRASDGELLWQEQYALVKYRMSKLNSYATATPAVDADNVYILWPTAEKIMLVAINHDGDEIWRRTFGGLHSQHGSGTSPIVFEDIVVFTCEHEETSKKDAKSFWIAVDRHSGQTRWQLPRDTGPKTSYSTPCVYSPAGGKPHLVFSGRSHGMTGVDPRTGKVIWEMPSAFAWRVVSSPVIADGLLIGACGDGSRGKSLIAIRLEHTEQDFQPQKAYEIDDGSTPYVPTSVAAGGLLFTFHDMGYVSCLRSATGERLWREKPAKKFYGSPVWAQGRLYCVTTDGEVVVVGAAESYKLLAVNPLGERSHATPAIAGGRMYLRTYSHLISVGPHRHK
ncbi:MAG: PQQ-binding-like beta-propeller repeat protein [Phycisphaerales bacterium]|nr:MAG: PQQ-binding-like beta-propeller repeat protein [Phycisphaerales bacterium]